MAGLVVGLVFDRYPNEADIGELMVALVLADAADHDGSNVRPSVARIARLARQSERSVQYKLRDMQHRGFLHLVKPGGGKGRPSEYRIDINWLESQPCRTGVGYRAPPASHNQTVQSDGGIGEASPPDGCRKGASRIAPNPPPPTPDPHNPLHQVGSGFDQGEFLSALEREARKKGKDDPKGWAASALRRVKRDGLAAPEILAIQSYRMAMASAAEEANSSAAPSRPATRGGLHAALHAGGLSGMLVQRE